jgi:hypothetical protein
MEIMLNGQLVTCTPDEYARLIQLGLIPTQAAGTKVGPLQITPKPSLPDDIVPLPKEDFPQQYRKDDDIHHWIRNGEIYAVPLYGCVVRQDTAVGDQIKIDVQQMDDGELKLFKKDITAADNTTVPKKTYYVLKKKGVNQWWSNSMHQFTTTNEMDARLFSDIDEATKTIKYINDNLSDDERFRDFEIVPSKR